VSLQFTISRSHLLWWRQQLRLLLRRRLLLQWQLPKALLLTVPRCKWAPSWSKAELLIIWMTWMLLLLLVLMLLLLIWQLVRRLAEHGVIWAVICIRITTRRFPKPSCTKPCHIIM
jgi:hypothetical protein